MQNKFALEKMIGKALSEVTAELRMIDAVDYVAFLRLGQYANVGAIVNSATELYYKPGVLQFAGAGFSELSWREPPVVLLEMTFDHLGVFAQFKLLLAARRAGVELCFLNIQSPTGKDNSLLHVHEALADAQRGARKPQARRLTYH
jgi:hypothetical protein